ncbi:hypothetical protein [Marinobacter sp. S0848L]|nr:hypothetical protein [Marinobacter sp. S0848L]
MTRRPPLQQAPEAAEDDGLVGMFPCLPENPWDFRHKRVNA